MSAHFAIVVVVNKRKGTGCAIPLTQRLYSTKLMDDFGTQEEGLTKKGHKQPCQGVRNLGLLNILLQIFMP